LTDRTTRREPHVSALFRYPLKSAAGIAVETLELDDVGAHLDRRWMLIDEAGRFISQREETRLALIRTALEGDRLTVSAPGAATYVIPDHDDSAPRERVTIWDDTVDAVSIGGEADEWFCEVLRTHCRLVYFPLDTIRLAERAYNPDGHRVGFADAYPLLVVGASSLADLNTRLAARGHDALPMNRFRPNIVIDGAESYAEDSWRRIAIGETNPVSVSIAKPCARCAITTTDQATAVRGKEPLATLATYRRGADGSVYFAQNAIHDRPGVLHVGAVVSVLE